MSERHNAARIIGLLVDRRRDPPRRIYCEARTRRERPCLGSRVVTRKVGVVTRQHDAVRQAAGKVATFPAGCFDVVSRQLKRFSTDQLRIIQSDDSSVTFDTELRTEQLIEMRYFTNVFAIVDERNLSSCRSALRGAAYRLLGSVQGNPTKIPEDRRAFLTARLERDLRLTPRSVGTTNDFVLMTRSSGPEILTVRLARSKRKREALPAGALRPELVHILLLVAGVKDKHTLLDPFAGSGAIIQEARRGFGVRRVIGVEQDAHLRGALGNSGRADDARVLVTIENGSIDRIVTDPPWGLYASLGEDDGRQMYDQSLIAMHRVLAPGGVAVVLSGSGALTNAIAAAEGFSVLKRLPILVSGKKAAIIKLQKT